MERVIEWWEGLTLLARVDTSKKLWMDGMVGGWMAMDGDGWLGCGGMNGCLCV